MSEPGANSNTPTLQIGEEGDENEDVDVEDGEVEESGDCHSQRRAKQTKKKNTATTTAENCLACGKKCTARQSSVFCTLCAIWCHKECAAMSDTVFKSLQLQMKETGMAWWACRSCLSFSQKINAQFKNLSQRMDGMENRIATNTADITTTRKEVSKLDREVQKLDHKMEELQERVENRVYEEMREREQRRLNLVIHGVREPSDSIEGNWRRADEDKEMCLRIFKTVRIRTTKTDIKFCRRVGQKSREPRPMVIGLYSEEERRHILEKAKDLQNTTYSDVNIVPDLTKKQRLEETKMREEVDNRNKELTREDREKNLKWLVVGKRGEKRIIKGQEREETTSRYTGDGGEKRARETGGVRSGQRSGAGTEYERDRSMEKRTGTRKKSGGAWNSQRGRERSMERSGETGSGEENRGEWRSNGSRYSNWREDRRRMRTVSVESERQYGKRGRKSSSDSDMETDNQKKKTTRH
jgi:predicted nuclease with TOPRIM domain